MTTNGWEDITIGTNTVNRPNLTVRANYLNLPNLLSDWTGDRANMTCSNYTFIARLRRDYAVNDHKSLLSNFIQLGYTWANGGGNGISVIFQNDRVCRRVTCQSWPAGNPGPIPRGKRYRTGPGARLRSW